MDNNNTIAYRSSGVNSFDHNVLYTNGSVAQQVVACTEQNVRQFLDDYCVNIIQLIIQEMQFFLNMTTCKATKKHLFTRQNRGEQKMQGIIDISYRQINTLTLQIVVPLRKLDATHRKIVLHWMYDECDKLCDQFQSNRLDRTDLFFEHLINNCEKELKEREATHTRSYQSKKSKSTSYQSNQQQLNSNEFAVPPPPYTSPNDQYGGTFLQNSYQPQTYYATPQPQQQVQTSTFLPASAIRPYSSARPVAQTTPYIVRSEQSNTVTQSQCVQRPMTAPIHCKTTESCQSNINQNAIRNQWSTQSTNPFQQLIPPQNAATSQIKTLLDRPQRPMNTSYNQQMPSSNQIYGIVNGFNGNQSKNGAGVDEMNENPSFQEVFSADNITYVPSSDDQQAMLNATGFEAMSIQRQTNAELNAPSSNANGSRKRNASTYLDGYGAEKSSRNELFPNPVSQSVQPQQQFSIVYGECITDGTKTPTVNLMLEMNEYMNFDGSAFAANNENSQMQTSNELHTPPKRTNYQTLTTERVANDERCLSDAIETLDFHFEAANNDETLEVYDVEPAEVTVVTERADENNLQSFVDGVTEPMPSMPDLSDEQCPEISVPKTADEPNVDITMPEIADESIVEKLAPETSDAPNIENSMPEMPAEPNTSESTEKTTTEIGPTTLKISSVVCCATNALPELSDALCTSASILSPSTDVQCDTNEQKSVNGIEINNIGSNGDSHVDGDADCEVVLVETHTNRFQPIIKKEEPLDDTETGDDAIFKDIPSTRRKCNRYIDLTEDDEDGSDSDVLIVESDEEDPVEQKFVSILNLPTILIWSFHCGLLTDFVSISP